MKRLAAEQRIKEDLLIKEEDAKREIEMEALRDQIARDRDEENRITEQARNKELQSQLAVSTRVQLPVFGLIYGLWGLYYRSELFYISLHFCVPPNLAKAIKQGLEWKYRKFSKFRFFIWSRKQRDSGNVKKFIFSS